MRHCASNGCGQEGCKWKIRRQKALKCLCSTVVGPSHWGVCWTSITSLIGSDCCRYDVNVKRCQIAPTSAATAAVVADQSPPGCGNYRTGKCGTGRSAVAILLCGNARMRTCVDLPFHRQLLSALKQLHSHETPSDSVAITNYLTFTYIMMKWDLFIAVSHWG